MADFQDCENGFLGWQFLAAYVKLWGMAREQIKVGQVVAPDGMLGVYRVVGISQDGQTADIEKFDVSNQKSMGDPIRSVAINKLLAYKEDVDQTEARIVREAITED